MSADTNQTAQADTNPLVSTTTTTEEVATKAPSPMDSVMGLAPFLLIFVVIYFLVIRPQSKRERDRASLVSSVKKGEEVVTHSGIYGTVTRVTEGDDTIELTIAKDVAIKVAKSAIADIVSRKSPTPQQISIEKSSSLEKKKKGK